jgi:hypothetical protein
MSSRMFELVIVIAAAVVTSCGGGRVASDSAAADSGQRAATRDVPTPQQPAAVDSAALDTAARRIVGFLRGQLPFDSIRVADTVTLYVSPEGGGARTTVTREQLRDRTSWRVRGPGGSPVALAVPAALTKLTTRVGRHIKCMEYQLSSTFPELARLPHVGTKVEPAGSSSCLQTRNLTLLFDPNRAPPTLVAAVYDQWEW